MRVKTTGTLYLRNSTTVLLFNTHKSINIQLAELISTTTTTTTTNNNNNNNNSNRKQKYVSQSVTW